MSEAYSRPGYDRLWLWFSLSRASFLTVPRVLMHEMPDEWQDKMAALLEEYDDAFPNRPEGLATRVVSSRNGKFMAIPEWILNYRRPDRSAIETLRGHK